ncbi:MAG: efflux RND transporter periplasmic adaptor subunit [Clostridiales bacterium]|nr:efflux RND transporter periplasmic adaptor subunit [Clostridiales bacterium]
MNELNGHQVDPEETVATALDFKAIDEVAPFPQKPKRSWGGLIVLIVFLLLIGGAAYWRLLAPKENLEAVPQLAVQVYTATAELGDIAVHTVLTGKIRASEEAAVLAPSTAEVKNIYVEKGDHVKKGDRLFSLDGTQVQGGYNQAQVAQDMAFDGVEMAKQNLERMQALYDGEAIPVAQLEQAENQLTQAENQLRQAQAALASASSSFGLLNFSAPVSGVITEINIKEGLYPLPQMPALLIASLDDLEIAASVSEYLIGHLKEGDIVSYCIDSLNGATFQGTIKEIALAPSSGTITYPITIAVEDSECGIKPGMFAELSIPSQHKEGVIIIPVAALMTRGGKTQIAVLSGELPYVREIETGLNNGDIIEVVSGLLAGETVITKGQHYIVEGEAVLRLAE